MFADLTVPELERIRRDLRASLGLSPEGSPVRGTIERQLTAIADVLSSRAGSRCLSRQDRETAGRGAPPGTAGGCDITSASS